MDNNLPSQPPTIPPIPPTPAPTTNNTSDNGFFSEKSSRFYPVINIPLIQNPKKLYAVPLLGILIKLILLIPVFLLIYILYLFLSIVSIINSFIVLFTGKYWRYAFNLSVGINKLSTKLCFYLVGLTDKYPGFTFKIKDSYTYEMPYPEKSNRLYAIPFIGIIIRFVLIFPFLIYSNIISTSAYIGIFASFVRVLFKGAYPESTYELTRDAVRINNSAMLYLLGISDKYPGFWISLNHEKIKIILLSIGLVLATINGGSDFNISGK